MGLGNQAFLSSGLLISLRNQGLHFLFQAVNRDDQSAVVNQWKSARSMGLIGREVVEWEVYCKPSKHEGI